ncbi:Arm DNA-binding domain-containing protein [Massilia niabensis]|uniref:Arm DNA-binding domain-containing protein n=1 Tax=Massilia niabensis TaxID=544910 RepID=A0ABW0L4S4_9BURK
MPLNLNKLSALGVTKTSKPGFYGDGGGLWLQVAKSGSKSWIFRFKVSGRQREMGLGGLHTVDLAKARVLARECRTLLLDGKDPIEARKAVRLADALQRSRSITFDQCAGAYINAHSSSWKNVKHAEQWQNTSQPMRRRLSARCRWRTSTQI